MTAMPCCSLPSQNPFRAVLARRPVAGPPDLVHLSWEMDRTDLDVRVQIYIDGRWHDTVEPDDGSGLWLVLPAPVPTTVELLAVPDRLAWVDLGRFLGTWRPPFNSRAELAVVRDEALPADSRIVVTVDGQDRQAGPLWDAASPRGGFGGLFGYGQFGYERATSPGFGLADFGAGPFGSDGRAWRWEERGLAEGSHDVDLRLEDGTGRPVAALPSPLSVTIDRPAAGPTALRIEAGQDLRWDLPCQD